MKIIEKAFPYKFKRCCVFFLSQQFPYIRNNFPDELYGEFLIIFSEIVFST
jgi:hypothetical protein